MADSEWLVRYRTTIYLGINGAVLAGSLLGGSVHDVPFGVAIYVCALVALCSAPVLLMRRLNDRHVLLAIFMGLYFLAFGALDLQIQLIGTDRLQPQRPGVLTSAELAILLGAAAVLLGAALGVAWGTSDRQQQPAREWPAGTILVVGLAIFVLGTASSLYFQIVVMPSKLGFAAAKGQATMSAGVTFMVMLGQMMQPVGMLILAYGYAKYRGIFWTTLLIVVVAAQVAVGFIEDIKAQAIFGGVLVIMTRIVVTNRVPKAWVAYMIVFLIVGFPIFQAYRMVSGERGLDRAQALQQLDKVLESVTSEQEKADEGRNRSETFLERSSVKANVELLFEHVGHDVPYLHGYTLVAIPMAFVPRLLAPEKEDPNIGQMFGKLIAHSDSGVFISISHLGELYWNFGWPGVFIGMFVLGVPLGFVGAKCTPEEGTTLTRVLVLLATAKTLCLGFEGTMPIAYILWMRSLAAIGLMHLAFARALVSTPTSVQPRVKERMENPGPTAALPAPVPRFPNLLR